MLAARMRLTSFADGPNLLGKSHEAFLTGFNLHGVPFVEVANLFCQIEDTVLFISLYIVFFLSKL